MQEITDRDIYYLGMAKAAGSKSKCLRVKVGVVIVKFDQIVGTGYAGAPRGRVDCVQLGKCFRDVHSIPSGSDYMLCRSMHGEQNAIIHAGRERCLDGTLYLYGYEMPCWICSRMIINSGIIKLVVQKQDDPDGKIYLPKIVNVENLEFEPPEVAKWAKEIYESLLRKSMGVPNGTQEK